MSQPQPPSRLARIPSNLPPVEAARRARLRHVSDRTPGIVRKRQGKRFVYYHSSGARVREAEVLGRIKALAIPPAWRAVWICPDPVGHLQATGRDQRGRKQYRYHTLWREVRDATKFQHMLGFGRVLPRIRQQVERDLGRPGLPREKVLAAVVRLMEHTLARIGNTEYARENHSFGLTTLRNRHVRIAGGRIELDFRAKSGVHHHSVVADVKLARILRNCRELPGSELFQYLDEDGRRHRLDSEDINAYLRAVSGAEITAKDFRTWAGTNLAFLALARSRAERPTRKQTAAAVAWVAEQLGNTPAVCRKCYIHPGLLEDYATGSLQQALRALGSRRDRIDLRVVEAAMMRFLGERAGDPDARRRRQLRRSVRRAPAHHHKGGEAAAPRRRSLRVPRRSA